MKWATLAMRVVSGLKRLATSPSSSRYAEVSPSIKESGRTTTHSRNGASPPTSAARTLAARWLSRAGGTSPRMTPMKARSTTPRRASARTGRCTETELMRISRTGAAGRNDATAAATFRTAASTRSRGGPKMPRRLIAWPRQQMTASWPATCSRRASADSDVSSASTMVSSGSVAAPAGRRAADRTIARTRTPRSRSCVSTREPIRPVAPSSRTPCVEEGCVTSPPPARPSPGGTRTRSTSRRGPAPAAPSAHRGASTASSSGRS